MKKYLEFKEIKTNGKTKMFEVYNKVTGDYLGLIHWKGVWRQYIFDDGAIEIALGCFKEFVDFMEKHKNDRNIIKEDI